MTVKRDPHFVRQSSSLEDIAPGAWGFLTDPYLLAFGGFLGLMASLAFANPLVHGLAMKGRWPALGMMAAIGIATALTRGMRNWTFSHISMVFLLVIAVGSTAYSSDKWYTFQRSLSLTLLFAATLVGLFSFVGDREKLIRFTDLVFWLGGGMCLAGFVLGMGSLDTESRFGGLYSRATGAGTYGALFLPIAIFQVRYRLRGILKVVGWFVIALLFLQIVLAAARTALVVAALVSAVMWFEYYKTKAIAGMICLLVFLPIPLLLSSRSVTERLTARSSKIVRTESIKTFTGRLDRWMFGLEQFARKPVLGHGLGVSRTLAGLEDPRRFRLQPGEVFNLHSDQIETLIDLGIFGYLFFAAFWLGIAMSSLRVVFNSPTELRGLGIAYLGSVAYIFVDTFMHGGFFAAGGGFSSFTWSLLVGLLSVSRHLAVSDHGHVEVWHTDADFADIDESKITTRASRKPVNRSRLPTVERVLASSVANSQEG